MVFDVDANGPRKINKTELYEDALVEVGIAADFIAHSAASIGLQTGFCRCFYNDDKELTQRVADALYIQNIEKKMALVLGIGHGIKGKSMTNPYTGKTVNCWSRVTPETRKLSSDRYITYR